MIVKKNISYLVGGLFVVTLLLMSTSNSFAAADNFTPYVYSRVSNVSNLFRVANDAEAISLLGNTDTDDTVRYVGAGFRAELPVSRQRIRADVSVDRVNYETFGGLNHTQKDGKATWLWQVGNLWSGNLGYRHRERLSTDYELQNILRDTRTQNTLFLDAGYHIAPDWRLMGSLTRSDQSYEIRDYLDRKFRSEQLEIQYKNTLNTRLGLRARVTEANFLNLDINLNSQDSKETEISGVVYWEGTNKSHFEARFGITDQKYDELTERNFRGSIGRMTYYWLASKKSKLDISLWRESDSDYDEITAFVITRGLSITPTWYATGKITLSGTVSYQRNNFENDLGSREDNVRLFTINTSYNPMRSVNLKFGYQTEKRTSNDPDSEFVTSQVNVNVRLIF
jgi:exopolysaccharide biosynthesis operon protein EpsL